LTFVALEHPFLPGFFSESPGGGENSRYATTYFIGCTAWI